MSRSDEVRFVGCTGSFQLYIGGFLSCNKNMRKLGLQRRQAPLRGWGNVHGPGGRPHLRIVPSEAQCYGVRFSNYRQSYDLGRFRLAKTRFGCSWALVRLRREEFQLYTFK